MSRQCFNLRISFSFQLPYGLAIIDIVFSDIKIYGLSIVTYHIYHDGKIERHIPENINTKYKNKYKYVYHDKNSNFHQLGIYEFIIIKNKYLSRSDKRYGNTEYIHLIDLREVTQKYEKYGLTYCFNVDCFEDPRFFMNRDTLASFFGAMLEVNFTDISCNGFSTKKDESGVSKSHKNGYHGDFKYLIKKTINYINEKDQV